MMFLLNKAKKYPHLVFTCVLLIGVVIWLIFSGTIHAKYPMLIRTIDRPDSGVGEIIIGEMYIQGRWSEDDADTAKFSGDLGTIGMEDYGTPYDDPKRNVDISFQWEEGRWIGEIPYVSTHGKSKTMIVYTDKAHSVWIFESEDRMIFAPAKCGDDVLEICDLLGYVMK